MAYRKPGTYARFIRTVSPAVDAGGSRILGLVGTGINYYTVQNEAIIKSSDKPYDTLAHDNVFEILSVSSKPIYDDVITTDNIIYQESSGSVAEHNKQNGYMINGNVITWDSFIDSDININTQEPNNPKFYSGADITGGEKNIIYSIVDNSQVVDGKWVIEVSYINEDDIDNNPKLGCYRIINANTSEIIGEYVVSDSPVVNEDGSYPIPGVALIVKNTYIISWEDYNLGKQPEVGIGDYITIITTAAKTEREALAYAKAMDLNPGQYDLDLKTSRPPERRQISTNPNDENSSGVGDTSTEEGEIIEIPLTWNEIIGGTNKYSLWGKTSQFEGYDATKPENSVFVEPDSNISKYPFTGVTDYEFNAMDLRDISGETILLTNKFPFTFSYVPADEEKGIKEGIKISIESKYYDKSFKYYYKVDGKEFLLSKASTIITVKSNLKDTKNPYIQDFGVYSFTGKDENDNDIKYNHYNYIKGEEVDLNYADDQTKIQSLTDKLSVAALKTASKNFDVTTGYAAGNSDEEIVKIEKNFHSTVFNKETNYYFLLAALDENQNAVDFAYYNTLDGNTTISADGDSVVGMQNSPNAFMINDEELNSVAIITADGVAWSSRPEPAEPGETNGNLLHAITATDVISNESIYSSPAVYRLTFCADDTKNKCYFRAVRYVNGEEDTKYIRYNGDLSDDQLEKKNTSASEVAKDFPPNPEESSDPEKPMFDVTRLIEIKDDEVFDYIDGVNIKLNLEELITCAKGCEVLIVTSPRTVTEDVPPEGDTYYVSYKYRKSDVDYDPIFFDNYDDIVDTYGNYDVSASSAVMNSLSLGAEIAFNNGVSQIVCCQARNNSDYEIQSAIDRMSKEVAGATNIQTIIPLTTSDAVGAYLQKHVTLMSSYEYGKERMGYLGARINQPINKIATQSDRTLGMRSVAEGYDDERIVYVPVNGIIKQIRDLRTGRYNERVLPGVYAAIAVASIGLSQDPAEPLTNKNIVGFTRLKNLFSENEKNQLAESGCCVLEHNGQNIRIRHGITTNNNEVNSQEITLIQIKDYVIDACRRLTRDTYIGRKLTQTIISDINYTIETMLENFISQAIIINYSSLKVARDKNEPRQVNVSFEIEAVYPLNWINIEFGFSAVQ